MLERSVRAWLTLPRRDQRAALQGILDYLPEPVAAEGWNTRFGARSLYDAWSRTTLARGVYHANAAVLRPMIDGRSGWRLVEVGGGTGALWAHVLRPGDRGELVLVDPVDEVHERVGAALPEGVRLVSMRDRVEEIELPPAEAVVCSLTLHHLAGADRSERRRHGLDGPGKAEVLAGMGEAVRGRAGLVLVNEADVYCDLGVPPGDEVLADRIMDSYIRRTGLALLDDLRTREEAGEDLRARWRAILHQWCLEQVAVVDRPVGERDVYELDVPRWLELFARVGLEVVSRRFTDRYGLFCQYVLRPGA